MMLLSLALLLLHLCIDPQDSKTGSPKLEWRQLADGIERAECENDSGRTLFVGFAGWSVRQEWANNWVDELWKARLKDLDVQTLVAVKGPDDVDYSSREIDTEILAGFIVARIVRPRGIDRVIVAAHSSGSYVAHALFAGLYDENGIDRSGVTAQRIVYFNLDGGTGSETFGVPITSTVIKQLRRVFAVSVADPRTGRTSPNADAMKELASLVPERSEHLELAVPESGCTGIWCLHETLITRIPHNSATFDLQRDYNCINAFHPVMTDYLEAAAER